METKTIWAVSSGEYSDYSVSLLFEAKEDAERYVAEMGDRYDVEEFTLVPAGMPFTTRKRLTVSWLEIPWTGSSQFHEHESTWTNIHDRPMTQPKIERYVPKSGSAWLSVQGDDHERVRKVFTEQLAGFKLELPLLKAAAEKK